MKKILLAIILVLVTISCKAQTPIFDTYQSGYGSVENAYYKDVNQLHDQYVGTWLFTNGSNSLKLVFQKRNMIYNDNDIKNFYEDFLVGEYQYIENGIEKVNTISAINVNYGPNLEDVRKHNILSQSWIKYAGTRPKCIECPANEGRLAMSFDEPSKRDIKGMANRFVLRRFFDNGVEKLKVWFVSDIKQGLVFDANDNPIDVSRFSLPFGTYVLTKQ
jgi:hypothetical protein